MGSDPSHDHTGPPAWLETVRRRVAGWLCEGLGPVWVVAVSGGGDSVGLLRTLHGLRDEFGLSLSVAHLNHGVRGESAREDAQFVADLSGSLGLPFDLGSWRPTRAGHFEADARAARLAWLADVAKQRGATAVAVGHTRDDQAETIVHRIVRGTGPRGLAGIPARRPLSPAAALVRPLLDVSRREIHDELARLGQGFREDATNADVSYTRARIRHDLIPKLEADYNPQVATALASLGSLATSQQRLLDGLLAPIFGKLVRETGPSEIVLERRANEWRNPLLATEILRRAWQKAGWPERSMTVRRWRRVAKAVAAGVAAEHLGEGVSLRVKADALILDRSSRPSLLADVWYALEAPGSISVPWAHGDLIAIDEQGEAFDEVVDRDQVDFPLTVRTALPGERFDPLGMDGRRQRVVEFLRLRRVPRELRAVIPVVADRKGIVWVVGHRIVERVRTRETTRRRLGLRWLPSTPSEVDGSDGLV